MAVHLSDSSDLSELKTEDLQQIRHTLETLGQLTPAARRMEEARYREKKEVYDEQEVKGWISPLTPIPVNRSNLSPLARDLSDHDLDQQGRGSPLMSSAPAYARHNLRPPPISTQQSPMVCADVVGQGDDLERRQGHGREHGDIPTHDTSSSLQQQLQQQQQQRQQQEGGEEGKGEGEGEEQQQKTSEHHSKPESPVHEIPDRPFPPGSQPSHQMSGRRSGNGAEVHYHINWFGNPNDKMARGMGTYVDASVINPLSQTQMHPQVQSFATRGGYIYADPSHPVAVAPHSLVNDVAPGYVHLEGEEIKVGPEYAAAGLAQLTHTTPPIDPEHLPRHLRVVLERASSEFQASLAVQRGNTLRNLKSALRMGSDAHIVEERGRLERENSLRGLSQASREGSGKLDTFELEQLSKSIGRKLVNLAAQIFQSSLPLGESANVDDKGEDAWDPSTHRDQFVASKIATRTHHPQDPSDPGYHVLLDTDDAQSLIRQTVEDLKKRLVSMLEMDIEDDARSKLREAEVLVTQRREHWESLTKNDVAAINSAKLQEMQNLADVKHSENATTGRYQRYLQETQVSKFHEQARQSTHKVYVEFDRILGDILNTLRGSGSIEEEEQQPQQQQQQQQQEEEAAAGFSLLSRMRYMALQAEFSQQELKRMINSLVRERDALHVKLAVLPKAQALDRTGLLQPHTGAPEASLADSLARLHLAL